MNNTKYIFSEFSFYQCVIYCLNTLVLLLNLIFFYVVLLIRVISVEICNVILVNSMEQSLALAHADIDDSGKVLFVPWDKTDFRTGDTPWWS